MEENQNSNIFIDDFNTIVKIDARGKIIKVYKHILMNSMYFRNIFDEVKFGTTAKQEDGSYFIDCDADIFRELLAYMETKTFKSPMMFNSKYIKFMTDKFGVDWEPKKREHRIDIIKKENEKQKTEFKQNLLNFVSNHIKNNNFVFSIEFYLGDEIEYKIISNELLIVTYKNNNLKFISVIYESVDLLQEFFNPIIPENHRAIYKIFRSLRKRKIDIVIGEIENYDFLNNANEEEENAEELFRIRHVEIEIGK
jgi:hypothetical protein